MGAVRHLAIAGNMGVGKSTLTAFLAERLDAAAYYESVDEHPYLERFYHDMSRWAFQSQFFFLTQAFTQHCEILRSHRLCIQDRTIYEHFHVFASSLHDQGFLADDDYGVLGEHFAALSEILPPPDLMVYLTASLPTLQTRIRVRERSSERTVTREYLQELEERYERWLSGYRSSPVMVVDTDDVDIHDPEQRESILAAIETRLGETARLAVA